MIPPSEKPVLLDTYSATGFIYMASSYNSDCSDVFGTYGIPVNECFVDAKSYLNWSAISTILRD